MIKALAKLPFEHSSLIFQLTKREVIGRYKGSALGILWSFIVPLVMLTVYTFVFGMVFKARWGVEGGPSFSVILFTGLIFHTFLAECLTSSPTAIVSKPNLVKKVVFPLEVLPVVNVLTSFFHFLISLVILFFAIVITEGSVPITWIALPLVFIPIGLLSLGFAWFLSALGVYLRDISQMMGVVVTLLMFLCPIFYPLSVIPEKYQIFILLNPLSLIVQEARAILVFGEWPNWIAILGYFFVSLIVCVFSFSLFTKTRKGFADVL